jgi:hypothetical protein
VRLARRQTNRAAAHDDRDRRRARPRDGGGGVPPRGRRLRPFLHGRRDTGSADTVRDPRVSQPVCSTCPWTLDGRPELGLRRRGSHDAKPPPAGPVAPRGQRDGRARPALGVGGAALEGAPELFDRNRQVWSGAGRHLPPLGHPHHPPAHPHIFLRSPAATGAIPPSLAPLPGALSSLLRLHRAAPLSLLRDFLALTARLPHRGRPRAAPPPPSAPAGRWSSVAETSATLPLTGANRGRSFRWGCSRRRACSPADEDALPRMKTLAHGRRSSPVEEEAHPRTKRLTRGRRGSSADEEVRPRNSAPRQR